MQTSERITRRSASNLALAFVLLPRPKRQSMSVLYAFCREVDDIADDESAPVERRRAELADWRENVRSAASGGSPQIPVVRELQPVIQRFRLPFDLFDELIRGVEMDLDCKRYPDLPSLERYCYRVASVVGLLSIEIFGYTDPRCREYAIALGQALQFTNILRDVGGDAARGRIYLPADELARHGVDPDEILRREYSDRFRNLAKAHADRARGFFDRARATLPTTDRRSMIAAELMGAVYWRLLRRIEALELRVLDDEPIRVCRLQKLLLVLRTWARLKCGSATPNYGS